MDGFCVETRGPEGDNAEEKEKRKSKKDNMFKARGGVIV